jgi:large subunit ribosomal protein L3e
MNNFIMSHRKFEHPRCGHLGFKPRKRARRIRGRIRTFPKDDQSKKPHLTAFMGYKVGQTHITRHVDRPGSYTHNKDVAETVTLIETPPMTVVGIVGYKDSSKGLTKLGVVWAKHLSQDFLKRVVKSKNQEQ